MSVHEVFPYLRVSDGRAAMAFYAEVFGATERLCLVDPGDGRIGHAEMVLGQGVVMLSDAYPEMGVLAPTPGQPAGSSIHVHCDDCDAVLARAVEAGGTITRPASNQFYGERSGQFLDPFGHTWMVGHHVEDVAPDEMQRRWAAMASGA